jgi:predicted ATPase/DNA-binding CsgD family transcriptional regulator
VTERRRKDNIPAELNSFVGRRRELADVRRLLGSGRLLTLTGVGGVGKTRLGLQVAAKVRRQFADGAWLVELAGLQDAMLLPQAVSEAVGFIDQSARDPVESLTGFLAQRQLLLMMDNCEQLIPAVALLVWQMLRAAPGLRVLVTSREKLHLPGEEVYVVAPLPVPDPEQTQTAGAFVRYSGLVLFAERAAAVWPGFAITAENAALVARICRRLDGIPLAIELAAARMRVLSAEQLASRLDDRLGLLTTGNRATLPRHQTMRAAVEWSFMLCDKPERLLWTRLSVFIGTFDLAAAERVCSGDGLPVGAVLEALTGLVDKSVLNVEDRDGVRRYRLLDALREYGLERLRDPAAPGGHHHVDEAVLRRRHRDFYLDLADRFDADWFGPRQVQWTWRMVAELTNLREALRFSLNDATEPASGVHIAGALYRFWHACGETREGRYWLDRALAADPQPRPERVPALAANARLLLIQGLPCPAADLAQECLDLARQFDLHFYLSDALQTLGLSRLYLGDPAAGSLLEQAVTVASGLGSTHPSMAYAKFALSVAVLMRGDLADADQLLAETMEICRANGDRWALGVTLSAAVHPALRLGDVTRADAYGRESLRTRRGLRDTHGTVSSVELLAWVAAAGHDHPRAARLLGAADRQWSVVGGSPFAAGPWLIAHDECVARTRQALGEPAFDAEFRRGADLTLDEVITYALGEGQTRAVQPPSTNQDVQLTRREHEIVELVAQGLSNKQIAAHLVISQRTAESHVANILTKLGFTSRTQIATWHAARHHHTAPPT